MRFPPRVPGAILTTLLVVALSCAGLVRPSHAAPTDPVAEGWEAVAWGYSLQGQTTIPTPPEGTVYTKLQGGSDYALGLRSDGQIVGWGSNSHGQLDVPELPEGTTYVDVAAGSAIMVALRSDGQVVAWGFISRNFPVPALPDGVTYTGIAAGQNWGMAVRSDGQAVAWGANTDGQRDIPPLPPGLTYTAVSAGIYFSMALRSDGTVVAFGQSQYGQLDVPDPPPGTTFTAIAAGGFHALALTSDGRVLGWGDDLFGQSSVPELSPGRTYTAVAAGYTQSLAITDDGQLQIWGRDDVGAAVGVASPPSVPDGAVFTTIGVGSSSYTNFATVKIPLMDFSGPSPSITGTAAVGHTLTAEPGTVEPEPDTLSYQWLADDEPIDGATDSTLLLGAPQVGAAITVKVTATKTGYNDAVVTSDATTPVAKGTFTVDPPVVTGAEKVGSELTCTAPDGLVGEPSFEWVRGEDLLEPGSTYTPAVTDLGKTVTCVMTVIRDGYDHASNETTTGTVDKGTFTIGDPVITGDAVVAQTLTCASDDPDATYAWTVDDVAAGTGDSYLVVPSDTGKTITCTITVAREGYEDATASAQVGPVGSAPTREFTVTVSGKPLVGNTLRGSVSRIAPSASVTWQWLRDGKPVPGATKATYDLRPGDYGGRFRLRATVNEPGYARGSQRSDATEPVEIRDLKLEASKTRVRAGGEITVTITNLIPGERWTLSFPRSDWSVKGTAPASGQVVDKKITIPDDLKKAGDRRLTVTTTGPDRQDSVALTLIE